MQLLNTLYVTLPDAWLRLDNDTLRVEVERETRLRVPLHHSQCGGLFWSYWHLCAVDASAGR